MTPKIRRYLFAIEREEDKILHTVDAYNPTMAGIRIRKLYPDAEQYKCIKITEVFSTHETRLV